MQVEIKRIDACNQEVKLIIDAETATNEYKKQLSKAAQGLVIPGFRKGKAPLSLVERSYGPKVKDYFFEEMAEKSFRDAVKEHELSFLMYPEMKDPEWNMGEDLVLNFIIETEPEIELKQTEGLKVPYKPILLENEVQKYIEELRNENSILIDVEDEIQDRDMVDCELSIDLENERIVLNETFMAGHPGEDEQEAMFSIMLGKKIGESFEESVFGDELKSAKNDERIDNSMEYKARFMINAIRRKQIPEIDDEFAKDLDFESLQQMQEKIASDMHLRNEHQNIDVKHSALIMKLYEENQFSLPPKALEHLTEKEMEQFGNRLDKNMLNYFRQYTQMRIVQDLATTYLLKKLREEYQVEVNDEMIETYILHNAILEDRTPENWKEANEKDIKDDFFKTTVSNYHVLSRIAETCEFFVMEENPMPELQAEETEPEEVIQQAEIDLEEPISNEEKA